MCMICEGISILDRIMIYLNERLFCIDCPFLTSIPNIKGLKELSCWNCPNLREIPNIEGLKRLYCWNCPLLISVSNIEGLKILKCNDCPNLREIPNIKELYCYKSCRYMFLTTAKYVYGSPPWLNHPDNTEYENNIAKLITLQRWFRRMS